MKDVRAQIDTLVDWATGHGARLHDQVEVYHDASTGLSLRVAPSASEALPAWAPIVSLPTALSLSYLNARDRLPEALLARLPRYIVGRLLLAHEFLAGRASFWWPYIQALPQPADRAAWALPPFWPAGEAELLEGTNVEVGVQKIRHDVAAEVARVRDALRPWLAPNQAAAASVQPLALALAQSPSLYHWAYCIFSSRSFRPSLVLPHAAADDFSVLLPVFDLGNHDMTTQVRWELDHAGRHCMLRVGRAHAPGQQIYNNYSMKTNAELLLGYGFMLPTTDLLHNDYTHVRKRTNAAPVAEDEYLISLRPLSHPSSMLARERAKTAVPDRVLGAFCHVEPDMVWDMFCTLSASHHCSPPPDPSADQSRRARFLAGRVDDDAREFLDQTIAMIQHKVLQELERLNETEYDVDLVNLALLTPNERLALDYRERCRNVLDNTLEAIDADAIDADAIDADAMPPDRLDACHARQPEHQHPPD
ncbi:hypothetical protein CDD82_1295 [Ophiocordyceps australis]|uniref:SET domain-containing protein n=1 Tax=Ophiocordyceps australis TaxID=1399860 RepID=A0A2C5YDK8_9HYPO|nr:hypothetical protein CDD82_1295 [Ophiocordyceps australis]